MNRGYDGNAIFSGTVTKSHFLDYIEDAVTKMKMRIFAYCIMDNHYHMVLLGANDFINNAFEKFDRRQRPTEQSIGSQRQVELYYEPVEKIIQEFQTRNDIDIHEIDTRSREGQRLRGELPVKLKEGAGLNYKEIAGIEIFKNLKFSTLRSMYRNKKKQRLR